MKKILISILIVISIAQIFAPFSVGVNNKQIGINKNVAEAVDSIKVVTTARKTDTKIYVDVKVAWGQKDKLTGGEGVTVSLLDVSGTVLESKQIKLSTLPVENWNPDDPMIAELVQIGSDYFEVSPSTTYGITTVASHLALSYWDILKSMEGSFFSVFLGKPDFDPSKTTIASPDPLPITTNPANQTETKEAGEQTSVNEDFALPVCELDNMGGCVGIILYRLVFQPSSYLFAITGKLLDSTLFYSIQDTSYRSQFVVEGWGIVRDICNMFFIFILLYIAFSTIMNTGGSKTKEMIVNVVIIGLLINFSLFAVQVLIDTSNVLTRVFYNQITTGYEGPDGKVVEKLGADGSKELTAALVSKINPQQLIIKASDAGKIQAKGLSEDEKEDRLASGISNATFIMVTIMASIMNIVGLWVFFVISLVFIARVVGLWMAMILAPIAFFSYIVPKMNNIDMIGWSKWWPETIKLSFVAPVFIFFLYIILQFLESGLGIVNADSKTGLDFYIATIVPFAFLMVLLVKTKDITTKMSGTLGDKITNGIKTAGALALGGAALGTASIGRRVIGKTMAKASRGDTATQKYQAAMSLTGADRDMALKNLNDWEKIKGKIGSKVGLGNIYGKTTQDLNGNKTVSSGLGNILNKAQKETNDSNAARKKADDAVDKAGYQGKEWGDLSGAQQKDVKDKYGKENSSKFMDEAEKKFRENAVDANGNSLGLDRRQRNGQLKALDFTQKEQVKKDAQMLAQKNLEKAFKDAAAGVNAFTRVVSKANTASYDVRKLSTVTSDKRASIFSKIPVALIGAVAAGVRGGMKGMGLSNGGIKVEGKFMKDLGNTISDSLKTMKINVDLSGMGATKSTAKEK